MLLTDLKAALAKFVSNYVYVANHSIADSDNIVGYNRLSQTFPSAWNKKVKRKFSFSGDTLLLQVKDVNRRLKWIRQNSRPGLRSV